MTRGMCLKYKTKKKTTVGKNFVLYDMYDINKASSLLNMSDSMNYR